MSTEKRFITATVIDVNVFGAIGCWLQISMFFKSKNMTTDLLWVLLQYFYTRNQKRDFILNNHCKIELDLPRIVRNAQASVCSCVVCALHVYFPLCLNWAPVTKSPVRVCDTPCQIQHSKEKSGRKRCSIRWKMNYENCTNSVPVCNTRFCWCRWFRHWRARCRWRLGGCCTKPGILRRQSGSPSLGHLLVVDLLPLYLRMISVDTLIRSRNKYYAPNVSIFLKHVLRIFQLQNFLRIWYGLQVEVQIVWFTCYLQLSCTTGPAKLVLCPTRIVRHVSWIDVQNKQVPVLQQPDTGGGVPGVQI